MPLNEKPDTVTWPKTHYVYVEKTGPFQTSAPQAWQQLHQLTPAIAKHNTIEKYFSLYDRERKIYRAGVSTAAEPKELPKGLEHTLFDGGKFSRFILTGSFSQLPEASGRVFEIVAEKKIPLRPGFNIEHYVNDPRTTPEDQLVTEIMFPSR
ncbi:MAG TPA: GyrI-like domain-containing protein [Silvibacterium sp.]|nr:GyrI-like domain-containing protein [Silvibacterium sp.]